MIDTHVHLEEIPDVAAALERARQAGIKAVIAVGSDRPSNKKVLELAERFPGCVFPALGLHPWALGEADLEGELKFIESNLPTAIALGEIGLDFDRRVTKRVGKEGQRRAFERLLGLAAINDKPVIVHARYSWGEALQSVQRAGVRRAVFHWYAGPLDVLDSLLEKGYLISATPAAEYHPDHRRAVAAAPLKNLLLETDAPVEYGRESRYRAEPADLLRTLHAVAELKGISEEELARISTENAKAFFNLTV